MKIGIGVDHHGIEAKKNMIAYLEKKGYEVINYGIDEGTSDYPVQAFQVGEALRDSKIDFGILICGSGIGMSIACNKVAKVRCAKVNTKKEAFYSRLHNNANVIAIRASLNTYNMKKIVDTFLETEFSEEERHHRRVKQIDQYGDIK